MKNNTEILDEFGKNLISEVFDNSMKFINDDIKNLEKTEAFKNLFKNMNSLELSELRNYTNEISKGTLFNFLRIFEENNQFKLYYEADNQRVNLVEISEMLKAEPIIENGWIERFSKEVNKK